MWNPVLGEVHCLVLEEGNEHDRFAVGVERDEIIGHVPRELSREVCRMEGDQCVKLLEAENEETEVPCRYCFVAKWRMIRNFNKRCSRLVAALNRSRTKLRKEINSSRGV